MAAFHKMGSGPEASAFPKLQVVSLSECGTHAQVAAAMGSCRTGERELAAQLAGPVDEDMLVTADSGFYSWQLWDPFAATGAALCWRAGAAVPPAAGPPPAQLTAAEMTFAYHQHWKHESGLDEIKTHLRAAGGILRSQSPELAGQEMRGILLAHTAIRELMCRAADEAGRDPDQVSFIRTVRLVRRQVDDPAAFPPGLVPGLPGALGETRRTGTGRA